MKYAILIARLLLGVIFLFFGANSILHFLPMHTPPGDAGLFLSLLATHKYVPLLGLIEVAAGILLLVGRFVPLALTLLGPIVVNIFLFHLLFADVRNMLPFAVLVVLLELFLIFAYRLAFRGIFSAGPETLGSAKL